MLTKGLSQAGVEIITSEMRLKQGHLALAIHQDGLHLNEELKNSIQQYTGPYGQANRALGPQFPFINPISRRIFK